MAEGIRRREFSPSELLDEHMARAHALHPALRAFFHLSADEARSCARRAEGPVRDGSSLGPLHGVPVTVKSCIDVAGWPAPAGSLLRKDYVAAHDAVLVSRLKSAGAILLGNTATPEFLMAYETCNALHSGTANPWNLSHSAGGSSGGEAAAIASGCSAGGVGSDGGGSIRVPAHFCGICGLKPTPGRIASTGHFPSNAGPLPWLGVVGPMARTVGDLRLLLDVLSGPDPGDPCTVAMPLHCGESPSLRGLRVGLLESDALGKATDDTQAAVHRAAKALESLGLIVEPLRLSALDRALDLWWYFFGPVIAHLFRPMVSGQEAVLSSMFREYLEVASAGPEITFDGYFAASVERDVVRAEILRQMERVPVLLSPVCSHPAFRHGESGWREERFSPFRRTMRHSQWLNLAGLPGLSLPVSLSSEGLPIGVQLIGRPFEENLLLEVAEAIEQALGGIGHPPDSLRLARPC